MITTVDKNQDGKISYSEFRVRKKYLNIGIYYYVDIPLPIQTISLCALEAGQLFLCDALKWIQMDVF